MDYELLYLMLGAIILAGGGMWFFKFLRSKGYDTSDIDNSLEMSKLVLRFVTMTLSRKVDSTYKTVHYTDLIITAIEYLQTLRQDIHVNEKMNLAMDKIVETSEKLNIKLNNDEKAIIREVLRTTYDAYISLEQKIN